MGVRRGMQGNGRRSMGRRAGPCMHSGTTHALRRNGMSWVAETGRRALKILGINESDGMGKQDLVIFLYAVGLVRAHSFQNRVSLPV
jgi:hypothetical protein